MVELEYNQGNIKLTKVFDEGKAIQALLATADDTPMHSWDYPFRQGEYICAQKGYAMLLIPMRLWKDADKALAEYKVLDKPNALAFIPEKKDVDVRLTLGGIKGL